MKLNNHIYGAVVMAIASGGIVPLHADVLTGDSVVEADGTANPAEAGNLSVEGWLFALDSDSTEGGFNFEYTEPSSVATLSIVANSDSLANWYWGYGDGSGGLVEQMTLGADNRLSLWDTGTIPTARIVLDPGNGALDPSILIGGSEVLTANGNGSSDSFLMQGTHVGASATSVPASGAGTRMMWYPEKSAFRAGAVISGNNWDEANIGEYSLGSGINTLASGVASTALGVNTLASGIASTALGHSTIASGNVSTALGIFTIAEGDYSTAMGHSSKAEGDQAIAFGQSTKAIGQYSVAGGYMAQALDTGSVAIGGGYAVGAYSASFGLGYAEGDYSMAVGNWSWATGVGSIATGTGGAEGDYSFAAGFYALAPGYVSTAFGGSEANGDYSSAFGDGKADGDVSIAAGASCVATGDASAAFGWLTEAPSAASLAVGKYNEGRGTVAGETTWQGDNLNAVLEVGIGTSPSDKKNVITALQDGSVEIGKATAVGSGDEIPLTVLADGSVILSRAQGDISMGPFTSS